MADSTINGLSALLASAIVPASDLAPIWQASASTTKKVTVADLISAGATSIGASANTVAIGVTGYSLTGANAQSLVDLAGTWNTTGIPTAFKVNITDTASNAASLLASLQIGGANRFSVTKAGQITFGTSTATITPDPGGSGRISLGSTTGNGDLYLNFPNNQICVSSTFAYAWSTGNAVSGAADTFLYRDAAGVVAQKNSTTAQEFRVYGTTTGSKYASMKHDGTNAFFVPTAGQTAFASAALATSATAGFMTIPSCAGTPTGVPASIPTGQVPIIYDSTNNKLCVYNGAWKQTAALT